MSIDKIHAVDNVNTPLPDEVYVPTGADLRAMLLDSHDVLLKGPIPVINNSFLQESFQGTLEVVGNYYQVDVATTAGILVSGLFSKEKVDNGTPMNRSFYHAGAKYTLVLRKSLNGSLETVIEQETTMSTLGFPEGVTATYVSKEKKIRLSENWNSYQVIDIKSLAHDTPIEFSYKAKGVMYSCTISIKGSVISVELKDKSDEEQVNVPEARETMGHVPITSLLGVKNLTRTQLECVLLDGSVIRKDRQSGQQKGVISPDMYAAYINQPRSIYRYPEVVFDGADAYEVSLEFFGNQRAEIKAERIQRPIVGVNEEVFFSPETATHLQGIGAERIGTSRRKESRIALKKNNGTIGLIDFKQFSPAQQDILQKREPLREGSLPSIQGVLSLEGKPVIYSLSCEEGVITVDISVYDESSEHIISVRPEVETTERTIGTWKVQPVFSSTGSITEVSLELIGTKGVVYVIDSSTLKRVGTHAANITVEKKLQNNITYKITLKNMHDELQVSLDQQDGFPNGGMENIREEDQKPLPDLPRPPPKVLPPEEIDDEDDDLDHEGHEEAEPEIVVVNPWEKEKAEPSNPMSLEGEIINGYYKNPRLLPGSGPLDLDEVYMQPGGGAFSFRLREKDRIFDNNLLTIPLDKIKLGTIVKIAGENGRTRKVRVDVYDKKLAFSVASPGGKRERSPETIDGVPVLYSPCYPPGKRTAGIKMQQPDGTSIRGKTGTSRGSHGGLDIAGPKSTDILASASGEVVYVKDNVPNNTPDKFGSDGYAGKGTGYGNTVVILLPGGYLVSYHHLSPGTITVKEGMQVSVGDPIAKMGNSGQVRSSRRDGTHLHLGYYKVDEAYIQAVRDAKRPELFKESNAKKSAGFRWLDPETYLRDGPGGGSPTPTPPSPPGPEIKKTPRNWITPPEAKPFPREVVGSTPEQRLKSFVTYMGYDSAIINRLSAKHNIDPALIPAIIRAEHGKGPPANNNPGNVVGISPTSLEEGLTKMAEVFSNSYQSQNKTIGSLNGYGRRLAGMPSCDVSGQYCYATDTSGAWHNNVTNFMSFVYDTKIDYTYQFRRSAKHRESADTEYLKRTPNKYVTERCMFNNVSYNSYMPQLSPPIGQDPQNAPWGWLIRIQDEKISLVTPSGTYPLTSSRISVEGVSYTVRATLNTTDPLYPRAAQFSLSR